jgi:DNA-binding NtrC family response regulator
LLAEVFLKRVGERFERPNLRLSDASRVALQSHSWPGNVRELENALERAGILAETDIVEPEHLGLQAQPESAMALEPAPSANATQSEMSLEDYFQHFVLAHQDRMSETELAKRLGISRKSLWERRQRLGIPRGNKKGND